MRRRRVKRRRVLGKLLGLAVLAGVISVLAAGKLPAAALPEDEPLEEIFREPVRLLLQLDGEITGKVQTPADQAPSVPDGGKTDAGAGRTPKMPELPVEEPAQTSGEPAQTSGETAQTPRAAAVPKMPELPVEETPDAAVPESDPVEASYFADTVFLGDSRTEGLYLYGKMTEGKFLYAVGATSESVFTKRTQTTSKGKVPMLDALADMNCGKVYIMLGVNELGWPRTETFHDQYGKVIDRVRQDHPDATVVIQSLLPVSAAQDAKGTYVNNRRILEFNDVLMTLAQEKNCLYLNVAEAVTGEDGCLRPELTSDGVHLNTAGCALWRDYLMCHPIPDVL